MKESKATTTILAIFLSLLLVSCNSNAKKNTSSKLVHNSTQHLSETHFSNPKAEATYQNYIKIKTALVDSDATKAQLAASLLLESTADSKLKNSATTIAGTDDLQTQRKAFVQLTANIEPLLESTLLSGKIIKQFCPMAFNNKGGYWFSERTQIQNPYFGKKMLKCGLVSKTIEKK